MCKDEQTTDIIVKLLQVAATTENVWSGCVSTVPYFLLYTVYNFGHQFNFSI